MEERDLLVYLQANQWSALQKFYTSLSQDEKTRKHVPYQSWAAAYVDS